MRTYTQKNFRRYTAGLVMVLALLMVTAEPTYAAQQLNVPQGAASLNWSGYVAQPQDNAAVQNYTSVTGTWVVPTVSASTSASGTADATWVGIGGVSTHDLIQAGTQAIVKGGSVAYSAWVETLPGYSETVSLPVAAGDSVTSTLAQQSSGTWVVTIQDNTTGQSYSANVQYNSSLSSAEWIEEMVSNGNGTFIPLDSFGTVGFSNASATVNGSNENLSQLGAQPLQMVNGTGSTLANASALGSDNASFTVSRTAAPATPNVPRTVGGRWHMITTATSTPGQAGIDPNLTQIPVTITIVRHRRGMGSTSGGYRSMSIPLGFTFSIIRF